MSSLSLTDRQRNDLNAAIFEYLVAQGDKFSHTATMFKQEAGVGDVEVGKALLEKKWTSVVRLQKRVMELEAKVEQLQQQRVFGADSSTVHATGSDGQAADSRLLPKPPAKATLTGHRAAVTVVVTHPVYSLIASGSEDTTIRIWDFETGQYERTLKGHTGAISGLAFDVRGAVLASCSVDMSTKVYCRSNCCCCVVVYIIVMASYCVVVVAAVLNSFLPTFIFVLICLCGVSISVVGYEYIHMFQDAQGARPHHFLCEVPIQWRPVSHCLEGPNH
jgi:hypothetical protein